MISRVECISSDGAFFALRPMIGMAGQNGSGPINLFQEHHANNLVWPGCRSERAREVRLAPQFGRKSVRTADYKNYILGRIAEAAQMLGNAGAVDALAAFVERDE